METQFQHLIEKQHNELLKLSQIFEKIYGTLGTRKIDPVDFKLKQDEKPILSRTYPVPKVHEEIFKKEVERLVLIGFLEVANNSEWGTPSFSQHKPKSNQLRFLSDYSNLNKQLKQKPYLIPKLNEILLRLEFFQCATSLDLNMGYYHIRLRKNASNLSTIILPWVKCSDKHLTMGFANSPDIFQQKINNLFHGF